MQPTDNRPRGVRLREILSGARFCGADDIQIESCSCDPHQCRPGDAFVALAGEEQDGHDQAHLAIRHGAVAVVSERLLPVEVPSCVVEDTREAFGQICHSLVGFPARRLRVVGISGTNGKTTTCHLVSSVLQAGGHTVGISSSLGRSVIGGSPLPSPAARTTPTAAELARWLAGVEAGGGSHAVVEASSAGLAQRRLAGLNLDIAILTNVRRDHLELHGTVSNYRQAKQRLLTHLKPDGIAVVNVDDPTCRTWASHLDFPVITVGHHTRADVTATMVERHRSEQTFLLSAGSDTVPVRTSMIGDHHLSNCLAAAAVGLAIGLPMTEIARGLEAVQRIPGRLDRIECGQPFGVFVDAAETPDHLAVCLGALRPVTQGRVICVFSAQVAGRHVERPLLGRVVERGADLGVITVSEDGHGDRLDVLHELLDGYDRPARAHVIPTRGRAISWALAQARPGDSVLIAGGTAGGLGDSRGAFRGPDQEMAQRLLTESEDPAIIPFPIATNEKDN